MLEGQCRARTESLSHAPRSGTGLTAQFKLNPNHTALAAPQGRIPYRWRAPQPHRRWRSGTAAAAGQTSPHGSSACGAADVGQGSGLRAGAGQAETASLLGVGDRLGLRVSPGEHMVHMAWPRAGPTGRSALVIGCGLAVHGGLPYVQCLQSGQGAQCHAHPTPTPRNRLRSVRAHVEGGIGQHGR